MKKKLTAMVLAAAMVVTSLFTGITPVKAGTINWEKKEIPVINNIAEWENAPAMFTNSISLLDRTDESVMDYVSFTLKQDSWVIMKANSSMVSSKDDGHETRVDVFSDASGAHKVMELEDTINKSPTSLIDKESANLADSLNRAIFEKTNGIVDLKSFVMLLLGAYAAYDINSRPTVRPSGYTCLWWIYSTLAKKI